MTQTTLNTGMGSISVRTNMVGALVSELLAPENLKVKSSEGHQSSKDNQTTKKSLWLV